MADPRRQPRRGARARPDPHPSADRPSVCPWRFTVRSCWPRLRHPRGKSSSSSVIARTAAGRGAGPATNPIRRAAAVSASHCEPLEMRRMLSAAYTLTDLGSLVGFGEYTAQGMNANGDVVGYAGTSRSAYYDPTGLQGWIYTNGKMQALGGTNGVAESINDSGQVVGWFKTAGPLGDEEHAFLYSNGTFTDLHDAVLGAGHEHNEGEFTLAHGINNAGQVVGEVTAGGGAEATPWVYAGGTSTPIHAGETGAAYAIGNGGVAVGQAGNPTSQQAFSYSGGQVTPLSSLNGEPFANSGARGVNNAGDVVGYSDTPLDDQGNVFTHAFLYTAGQ